MVRKQFRHVAAASAAAAGAALAAYGGYAAITYLRYGRPSRDNAAAHDVLLDWLMPAYDVVERESIAVNAPAEVTLATASEMDITGSGIARAIFKGRELLLRSRPEELPQATGLVAVTTSIGWRVLAEIPGRELVLGAVTQPWMANVLFESLPPEEFARYSAPDHVKIAWTLRADPLTPQTSMFRTETRAIATDAEARRKFRRYWALLSPGIILIRKSMLRPLRAEAERRAAAMAA